jgi:hypothetical protein
MMGCSGGRKAPKTLKVSGKVIYKDQPVADAQIGFVPKLENIDVFAARGVTNSNGEFTLSTYVDPRREVSGATPGEFIVTVTKVEKIDPQQVMANFSKGNPTMKGFFKPIIPAKYNDAKQTTLTATVEAGGKNQFEFKLED